MKTIEDGKGGMRSAEAGGEGVPVAAWLLGAAGLIPFLALSASLVADIGIARPWATLALMTYGAVILSFMGGVHWGLAMVRDARQSSSGDRAGEDLSLYGASVIPALVGWFAILFLDPGPAMAVMAAGFAGLLAYDFLTIRRGLVPAWYAGLRFPLTVIVVLSLLVGGWGSAYGF